MGVSRDAVLAAILERGACASEPTGARPEARSDPARRSGALVLGSDARGSVWPNGPLDHD